MPYSRYLELRREVFLMSTLDVEPHRHFFSVLLFSSFWGTSSVLWRS
jgi:hypothetical protein